MGSTQRAKPLETNVSLTSPTVPQLYTPQVDSHGVRLAALSMAVCLWQNRTAGRAGNASAAAAVA